MNRGPDDAHVDPVEAYLDELADASRLRGSRLRHVLAETEDHLLATLDRHLAAGRAPDVAARLAVAEFGPAAEVAAGLDRAAAPALPALLVDAARGLVLLAAAGLLAIGASGLLAAAGAAAFGTAFVSGDAPGVTYTPARCAEYQQLSPARSCALAAQGHHYDEVVGYREDAGVLGLLVLAGWAAVTRPWRRRAADWRRPSVLPTAFAATVATTLFGAAAAVLLPAGVLELVVTGPDRGAGNPVSAGVVAAVAFAASAAVLYRRLTARPA